jgi:hypothetical protein
MHAVPLLLYLWSTVAVFELIEFKAHLDRLDGVERSAVQRALSITGTKRAMGQLTNFETSYLIIWNFFYAHFLQQTRHKILSMSLFHFSFSLNSALKVVTNEKIWWSTLN